jgi:hypothetical protein
VIFQVESPVLDAHWATTKVQDHFMTIVHPWVWGHHSIVFLTSSVWCPALAPPKFGESVGAGFDAKVLSPSKKWCHYRTSTEKGDFSAIRPQTIQWFTPPPQICSCLFNSPRHTAKVFDLTYFPGLYSKIVLIKTMEGVTCKAMPK